MRLTVELHIRPSYCGRVENPRKVVLLALTKGWWFRPLYEQLHYGEKVLCFQFIDENRRLSDAAFESAVKKMFSRRAKPKKFSAMAALLTAANDIAQQLPKRPSKPASIHILKIEQNRE
jgi:hypothetical protein